MAISSRDPINFNQMLKPIDLWQGGNCFGYAALFFSYVFMHSIIKNHSKSEDIDYSTLTTVLNNFDQNKKRDLQNLQSSYQSHFEGEDQLLADFKLILDYEVGILNDNKMTRQVIGIDNFCEEISDKINNFTKPIFYFLHFRDDNQSIFMQDLRHVVGFYLPSSDEIHFFDSMSGLYFIKLPPSIEKEFLKKTFIDLLFKKNFIFKWFVNDSSPTLKFSYESSVIKHAMTKKQLKIYACLESYIENPQLPSGAIKKEIADLILEGDNKIPNFLERNIFILKAHQDFKRISSSNKAEKNENNTGNIKMFDTMNSSDISQQENISKPDKKTEYLFDMSHIIHRY